MTWIYLEFPVTKTLLSKILFFEKHLEEELNII
ncbi:hypothetical protein SAMN06265346_101173 [Flavobacterium hercynium]|nr:hypothetical protein SAMN06265346_101173 [Flavobacterium hercynium]